MEKRIIVTAELNGIIYKSEVGQIIKGEETEQIAVCQKTPEVLHQRHAPYRSLWR